MTTGRNRAWPYPRGNPPWWPWDGGEEVGRRKWSVFNVGKGDSHEDAVPVEMGSVGSPKSMLWCGHCCAWSTDSRVKSGTGTQGMAGMFSQALAGSKREVELDGGTRAPLTWAGTDTPRAPVWFGGVRNGECC